MDSIIPSSEEGMVCQTCGDTGFTNAFIYCVKCLGYVIHRYCLDVIPKTHDEFVFWVCEDCKPAGTYKFALPKHDLSGPNKEDPAGTAIVITHPKIKQKKSVMKRQKKKSKIAHMLAGKDEVSCLLKEDVEKLASGTNQLDRCVVLELTQGASQNQSLESSQLISCSPVEGSVLLDHEPLQTYKEDPTTAPRLKTTHLEKLKENQMIQRKKVSLGAGKEDNISCPTKVTNPDHEYVLPTNPLPKEVLVKSDSGPNQTTPCVEKCVFQKQPSDSAELNNSCPPLKENEKRKSDATSLATNTKEHKTQKDMDPIDRSSCDSSCTEVTKQNTEEQRCEIKQSKFDHDNLDSDAPVGVLSKNNKVTANRMHNEQSARVSRDGVHPSVEELSKDTKNYIAEVETAKQKPNQQITRVSRDGADALIDEPCKKTKDYDDEVERTNRLRNKLNVSRDGDNASFKELSKKTKDYDGKVETAKRMQGGADASVDLLMKKTKDRHAKVETENQVHNKQNARVSRHDDDASIGELSKKTKDYDAKVETANRMHNKQRVRVSRADALVGELKQKTKDHGAKVETENRMHYKPTVRVSRDDADASVGKLSKKTKNHGALSKKTKDHSAKVDTNNRMQNKQNVRVRRDGADASIDKLSKRTKDYDVEVETASWMHNRQNVRLSKDGEDASQTTYSKSNVEYIHHQPARPVLTTVWRGSLDIAHADYTLYEGFVGHLSSKACLKVCQEASTLPSLLCLEMQPKDALWPKSFLESPPTDENIAVYFFPGDTKNERRFEQLVNDMMYEELAMKTSSKNAELLIFTSRVLPQPYWRFQGNYYLWGVFRGKRNESSSTVVPDVAVSSTSDNRMPPVVKSFESTSPQSPLCNYR